MAFLKRIVLMLMAAIIVVTPLLTHAKTEELNEPLLKIACFSDLNLTSAQDEVLSQINAFCKENSADIALFGGDIISAADISEEAAGQIFTALEGINKSVTGNALYAVGNNDYYSGQLYGYNSADFCQGLVTENLGRLSDADCYIEEFNGNQYILAYYYKLCGYDFIVINPSPRDMQGNSKEYNFTYTSGTLTWLAKKLNEVDLNNEQLMFLLAHFPLNDTNGAEAKATLLPDCTNELRSICASHSNLVYLYGNNATGTTQNTFDSITEYTVDGKKLEYAEQITANIPLSAMWTLRATKGGMQIINCATGLYLNDKLEPAGTETVWNMQFENNIAKITLPDGRGLCVDEKTGVFSVGNPSPLEVYCLTTDDYTDTRLTGMEKFYSNYDYLIVGASRLMMTNAPGEIEGTLYSDEVLISNSKATAMTQKKAKSGEMGFISCFTGSLAGEEKTALIINVYEDKTEFEIVPIVKTEDRVKGYTKYRTVLKRQKINPAGYSEEKEKKMDFILKIGKVAVLGLIIGIAADIIITVLIKKQKRKNLPEF